MKKLLMLGGAFSQVPAIKKAKKIGYYTITCDYLPENPGHAFADEYVNISTVDKEAVLGLARSKDIDGIIAYASDPSAMTAAYVCDAMQISGSTYESVQLLCEKDRFRDFQKKNGFYTPDFYSISDLAQLDNMMEEIVYPCMVKPVDSSGSRGVKKTENQKQLEDAVKNAFQFSRCGRVIIERYIESHMNQLHGDGIVVDGELHFVALGEQRFKDSVPIGTSFPARVEEGLMERVYKEVSRVIRDSGYLYGGVNIEVRITTENKICVVEIGPRTGGNYIPQLMELATGEDEMAAALQIAMGEKCVIRMPEHLRYCFQYIIGSEEDGCFKELYIDDYMREKVVDLYLHKKTGDWVNEYENSNGVVGVALLQFRNAEEMERDIKNIKRHIQVLVEREEK